MVDRADRPGLREILEQSVDFHEQRKKDRENGTCLRLFGEEEDSREIVAFIILHDKHVPRRLERSWLDVCPHSKGCVLEKRLKRCKPVSGTCRAIHEPGTNSKDCGICRRGGK